MNCIFCDNDHNSVMVEHIIPESFGNRYYVLQKGTICDNCNNEFSKFEGIALSNTVFVMERSRFGIVTKKGNPAKGKVDGLTVEGDKDFRKQFITVEGLNRNNFKDYDPKTKVGSLIIKTFDKSEVATSRLLLKIGLESIYKSQKEIYDKYDFRDLKRFLLKGDNIDWPFVTSDIEIETFKSIPTYTDKYRLKKNHCILRCLEYNNDTLLIRFKYGSISMIINLLNRDLEWIVQMQKIENDISIYPEHYKNKIKKVSRSNFE